MKAPDAQEFPNISAIPAKQVPSRKTAVKPTKAKLKTVRRSYNLSEDADKKVNALALKMSQERGKMVSASEAVRTIINAYRVR